VRSIPQPVASLTQEAFLLARYAGPQDGRPGGRAWERAASSLLVRPGLSRRQHAGTLGLFGRESASGVQHELDGAGQGDHAAVWLECKARETLNKADIAVFAFKCLDFYREAAREHPEATAIASWWPILVSSEPVTESVRRSCIAMGVALCEPEWMPLPMLMRIASKPTADIWIDEVTLSEFVRLAEPLVTPLQSRFRIDAETDDLRWSLREPRAREIGDLLFCQREITGNVFDAFDHESPHYFERHGTALADRLYATSLSV
jgi:hypothetical protein